MARTILAPICRVLVLASLPLGAQSCFAAPSAADALKLAPVQKDVLYDTPIGDELKACTIKAEKVAGSTAWVVRAPDGTVLRQFADTNDDNIVDRWSYFRDGLEVYRDVDGDFNGKADQYHWYHTAGSRVGLDAKEVGTIDSWQRISAEETAEEVVDALRQNDARRFGRLLVSEEDLDELGLAKEMSGKIALRTKAAGESFENLAKAGDFKSAAEFTDFGGLRPGMIPVGTRGSSKELLVYENAWAMVLVGDQHRQLRLGTMIRVGDAWKLIDGPSLGGAEQASAGFFFDVSGSPETALAGPATQPNEAMQKVLTQLEQLDRKLAVASSEAEQTKLNSQRADLLERLAQMAPTPDERKVWLLQLADMIGAGGFPAGVKRLEQWETELAKDKSQKDLLAHFKFRRMLAQYSADLSAPKADQLKVQQAWLEKLEGFVDAYRESEHVAEALLQLGMNSEFSGEADDALKWYGRIVKDFPNSPNAAKARGAVTRLRSEGQAIRLTGKSLQGRQVDLRSYRGKVVLIHYWATMSNAGSDDHATIKEVYSKFGGRKFDVVGVNLDYSRDDLLSYLKANRLPWQQLHEQGGFDGRLAKEMGVMTAPLMV
ncbi:MAG: redoxin domain-containing protein, partial [Planctomycetota bacterium]